MAELRNTELELKRFRWRVVAAAAFVLIAFGLIVARLVFLQVVRYEDLAAKAEANRTAIVPIVPNRGLIVDRNGVVLANNYAAYTLEITPAKVDRPIDEVIDDLATLVDVTARDRRRFKREVEETKSFDSMPLRTKLSDTEVARFTAQRFRFPGVDIKARLFRNYPYGPLASHVLGYIGRINQREKDAMEDWPEEQLANYRGTDYIGKLGIEQSYESELHGTTGFEEVETSAGGRAVRSLRANPATGGNTVRLSIDIKLQALIEKMFGDRRGALVAMDPRSGEILAFVSKPTFDPNLFVDGIDFDNWKELNESIDKPLLNRALRGTYPPGSTFKPFMSIAALESGKRSPSQIIYDNGFYMFAGHRFRSHEDGGLGPVDMYRAIVKSSNVYFYSLANEMGVDLIHDQLEPFGLGRLTGIDLKGEVTGVLPSTAWKRKAYRRPELQRWYAGETISLGIGQGYNNFTMLQLATALSTLSTGGQRFKPSLAREIENIVTHESKRMSAEALNPLQLDPAHVEVIRHAMFGVTQEGTSRFVFAKSGYQSGGKTGTAQAVGIRQNEKYNASKMDEYLRDHSLYTAFAPVNDPQVALAVVVENSGFGAEAAAPIARRVLDYWLQNQFPNDSDMALVRIGKAGPPVGVPLQASEVSLAVAAAPFVPAPVASTPMAAAAKKHGPPKPSLKPNSNPKTAKSPPASGHPP
jgi:penicillin-binding protein 2